MNDHQTKSIVSIITPVLNGADTLEECLASVAQQTYPHIEHWIIDGGSTDETLNIVKKWASKYPHIRYISHNDSGIYQAMNEGIKLSIGEWLYFMGCDDKLVDSSVLKKMSSHFETSIDLLLGNIVVNFLNKQIIRHQSTNWKRFLYCSILHQGCFYRRKIFNDYKYDESLQIASDYKLNLMLFQKGISYKMTDILVCLHSLEGKSFKTIPQGFNESQKLRREILPFHKVLLFNTLASVGFHIMQILKKILPTKFINSLQLFKQKYIM